jgi:hypothetical protein
MRYHRQIGFLGKTFFGCTFTKIKCTFLKSVEKDGYFDTPFNLFKEKKFKCVSASYPPGEARERGHTEGNAEDQEKRAGHL